jgi:hypothetical protein
MKWKVKQNFPFTIPPGALRGFKAFYFILFIYYFSFILYFEIAYTHRGARTNDHQVKSLTLYRLS